MSEQDLSDLFATSLQQALEPIAQRLSFLEQAAAQPSSSVSNCDEEDPRSGITNSLPQVDKDSADARGTILDSVRVGELPSSVVVDVEDKTPDRTSRPTVNMFNSLAETRSTGVEARRFQVSSEVASCLERALRHTLTRSERAELVLKFPRPDTPAATTPKLDRSLTDAFGLGRYTREPWFSVQDQLLDALGPLVALWDALVSKPSSMTSTEMESYIRTSITLLGLVNSHLTTKHRVVHLERVDKGLTPVAEEEFPEAGENLFGEQLLERITRRAETQQAFSTVLRRLKDDRKRPSDGDHSSPAKRPRSHSSKTNDDEPRRFFRSAGTGMYGGSPRPRHRPYQTPRATSSQANRGAYRSGVQNRGGRWS